MIVRSQFLTGRGTKGLCPSIPCLDREGGQSFWFFHVVKELNNENRWRVPDQLIGSCRNKVQVYRSVRMPQLHTLLHFHLTPIVMINGSSRRDLICILKTSVAPPRRGQRTRRFLGSATVGSGEVRIGEHSSWGGLTT